jgi:type I restriction-modification system DNA methylase subunit
MRQAGSKPLRKNLGRKNCEFADPDIDRVVKTFLKFEETEQSRIFDNAEFGYWKITVERVDWVCCSHAITCYRCPLLRLCSSKLHIRRPGRRQFTRSCISCD